jgi:hypothetical protein
MVVALEAYKAMVLVLLLVALVQVQVAVKLAETHLRTPQGQAAYQTQLPLQFQAAAELLEPLTHLHPRLAAMEHLSAWVAVVVAQHRPQLRLATVATALSQAAAVVVALTALAFCLVTVALVAMDMRRSSHGKQIRNR